MRMHNKLKIFRSQEFSRHLGKKEQVLEMQPTKLWTEIRLRTPSCNSRK